MPDSTSLPVSPATLIPDRRSYSADKVRAFLEQARTQGHYFTIQATDPILHKVRVVRCLTAQRAIKWLNALIREGYVKPRMEWIDLRHLSHKGDAGLLTGGEHHAG
jgi:hypothetical protein